MLGATKSEQQRPLLEKELDDVGIRLNKSPPDGQSLAADTGVSSADAALLVVLKRKNGGGIVISKAMGLTLTKIDEKMIRTILAGYKMHVSHALPAPLSSSPDHPIAELRRSPPRRHHSRPVHRCGARHTQVHALSVRVQQDRLDFARGDGQAGATTTFHRRLVRAEVESGSPARSHLGAS